MYKKMSAVKTVPGSEKWALATQRQKPLYAKKGDIRTPFGRDYTRILHSTAYRRLKHKTQVFFSPGNDHISTRIEHVNYVESIASTICDYLGLNVELARATSIGHDVGHPPFGHHGEYVLNALVKEEKIWPGVKGQFYFHERNGLHFVDDIELLEGPDRQKYNLDLTYAVRDGIVSHCGEVSEGALYPRTEAIDLALFQSVNAYAPFTWEACVVKYADKISYLGRDIEDALSLEILSREQMTALDAILADYLSCRDKETGNVNNTTVIHLLILDLCENSSPEAGIRFSDKGYKTLCRIQDFNYENIYHHERLNGYKDYGELIIRRVYHTLEELCEGNDYESRLPYFKKQFPLTTASFLEWISHYWDRTDRTDPNCHLSNRILYKTCEEGYSIKPAIIDYISGMTDSFIEKIYQEIIRF